MGFPAPPKCGMRTGRGPVLNHINAQSTMTSLAQQTRVPADSAEDIASWRPLFQPCRFSTAGSASASKARAAEALLLSVQSKTAVLLESGGTDDIGAGRLDAAAEELGAGAFEHRGAAFAEVSVSSNGREICLEVIHDGDPASPWVSDSPGACMLMQHASRIHHSCEGGICRTAVTTPSSC